jgi:hypothetical protein
MNNQHRHNPVKKGSYTGRMPILGTSTYKDDLKAFNKFKQSKPGEQ